MDASHPKTPTVIPLTRSLLKQLMKQQQQRLLTGGQAAQRSAPLLATQGQAPGEAQSGAARQNATVLSQQSGTTATGLGDHHHEGQGPGSCTTISVQVLNSNTSNSNPASRVVSQTPPIRYTYKIKIINPNKKSVTIVRYLHNVTSKSESVNGLCVRLMDEFEEHVPSTATFDVGYFEGKQQSKIWLVTPEDLKAIRITSKRW